MTTERDPRTRIVISWLREDAHENTERVLLRALDEVDTTPQRRSRWPASRTSRMRTFPTAVAAAAVLVLAIVGYPFLAGGSRSGGPPTHANAPAPPFGLAGNGVIAVAKDSDILVADRPGGDLRPLIAGPEDDERPEFSPDGTKLLFQRWTELGVYSMIADADGTNVVQLTREPGDFVLDFAPDGRSFLSVDSDDGEPRVVVRPVDQEAAPIVLDVRLPRSKMDRESPRFRPGNPGEILVVAQLEPDGPRGIYVVELATGGIRTIVEPAEPGYVDDVAWSPDGEQISYDLWDGTATTPRVVAADGSGDRAMDDAPSTNSAGLVSPWSNDGTRIVLSRALGAPGPGQPFVISTSGDGEPIELICGPGTDIGCSETWTWSPDDSMLIGTTLSGDHYQQADPDTGQVTEIDWVGTGPLTWQRLAP